MPPLIWCGKSERRRSGAATRIIRSTSIARSLTDCLLLRPPFRPLRAAIDSVSWLPMVNTGFSAVCGSCRIMDILRPRISRTSGIRMRTMSSPSSRMRPPTIRAASGSRRSSESAVMLLPEPDSPTSPSVSPSRIWKLTPSTARVTPHFVKRCVCNSCTSRTTLPAFRSVLLTLSPITQPRPRTALPAAARPSRSCPPAARTRRSRSTRSPPAPTRPAARHPLPRAR